MAQKRRKNRGWGRPESKKRSNKKNGSQEEVHKPVLTRSPPGDRLFPCSKCSQANHFDISRRALTCQSCGHVERIDPLQGEPEERPLEALFQNRNAYASVIPGRTTQVTCEECFAAILLEEQIALDVCPYCGSAVRAVPEAAEQMLAPDALIPFGIEREKAEAAFHQWLKTLWFAPNSLTKAARLGHLHGVYVPFWTFDAMTFTRYRGERGEHYYTTEWYTDASGKQQSRQVQRTHWYSVSGEIDHFFDDVLICASKGVPANHLCVWESLQSIQPESFQPEFLHGFTTERYTVAPLDGFEQAKSVMDSTLRKLICADIGGDEQHIHSIHTQHVGPTFKQVLLPIWLASYRFKEQSYRVVINGCNGRISADRPYSWLKFFGLATAIIGGIALLILIFAH